MVCYQQTTYWFRQNFLSLFIIIIIYLFLFISPLFCVSDFSISIHPISLNFDTVIGNHHEAWQEHFQGHQIIVTSSRRHFVKSHYPSYLHDAYSKGHSYSYHIYFRLRVNRSCHQRSHKGHDARVRARQNFKLLKIT